MSADDPAGERRHRGNEQHSPKAAFVHSRQRVLGEHERCPEVDRKRPVELLDGQVFQRADLTAAGVDTSTSIGPSSCSARLMSWPAPSGLARSAPITSRAPAAVIRSGEFVGGLGLGAVGERHGGTPGGELSQIAWPIPPLAPVTTATRPRNASFPSRLPHISRAPPLSGITAPVIHASCIRYRCVWAIP